MRNYIILLIAGFLYAHTSMAQSNTASIEGKITSADGQPVPGVNVVVKGTTKGASTSANGAFKIANLRPGSYTLQVSAVGLEKKEETVDLAAGEVATLTISLHENSEQLQEIVVTGDRANKFARKKSDYAARLPLENLENPQVYNVVTKELLQEQVIVNYDDALRNAPGVHKLWTSTGRGTDGAGYYSMRGFSVQPRLVNGIAGISNGSPDPANIESIETIKGPSGTLFGGSLVSFGGLINTVTKKPYEHFGGEASYTVGSFGLSRITADINTPLDDAKRALFRVNAAYHTEESFQDAGFRRSIFVAPSLSYTVNERLSFHINTEFYTSERTNPLMIFLNRSRELLVNEPEGLGVGYNRSYTSDDMTIQNPTMNLYGQINYKLSDKWTSQTNISQSSRQSKGYYQYVMFILPGDTLLNRYVSNQNSTSTVTNIQQNFIGDFNIGNMRNRLVVGIDLLGNKTTNSSSAYILFDTLSTARLDPRYTQLTRAAVDARLGQNTNPTKNSTESYTYSAYFSNVLNITDQLTAMASLRMDRFDNKGSYNQRTDESSGDFLQTAFSPKIGAVYQLVKNRASVFANYMNGFQNVSPATQPDGSVSIFDPQQANQWEAGIKTELVAGKITGTLSYYDIYVSNVTRPDPDRAGFTIQDGNISSRGIEADIIANPFTGFNIVAGYSYNDSHNDKTAENINGRRPVSSGPEHVANFWASYRLMKGALEGLGFGAGVNYASENAITNNNVTGKFILPAYAVYGATVFYDKPAYRLGVKIDNLTDQQYWSGWTTVEPQMPRRVLGTVALKF